MLDVDPSKCKRERTWGIKVYVGRYKDICESSGDKVIDHLSNFYVTRIVERIGPVAYRLDFPEEFSRVHNVTTSPCYACISQTPHMYWRHQRLS